MVRREPSDHYLQRDSWSMGEAELIKQSSQLIIRSTFYLYGDAASAELAQQLADDIALHWNEPKGWIQYKKEWFEVKFDINAIYQPDIDPEKVWYNDNPQLNFFRIEEYVMGDISFVDGLNCNTGYFKLANLLQTSTTAAHEYGHTIGLDHPDDLDIRGIQTPAIMYPRGTICDPHFQYDPNAVAGKTGGTLDPKHRKVSQADIDALRLHRLSFSDKGLAIVGGFSSIYHEKHSPPPSL